jgi:exopolysaccharide production protein ExoY
MNKEYFHTAGAELLIDGARDEVMSVAARPKAGVLAADNTIAKVDLRHSGHREVPVGGVLKRMMDIVLSLLALVLISPLMLVIAALIRVVMGGPIIFRHDRIGFNGQMFRCYKFRSMVVDADEVLSRYLASNPAAAAEWRQKQKLRDDPRVGCLGKVLRKSSLDELPQLYNVLRGDMSLIGPRPVVPDELDRYGDYAAECLAARPGVTGMWQVSGRSSVDYSTRVALDRYYVRRWSLWLDLVLLIKTIPAVLDIEDAA